jgi:hypothetical protein
MYSISILRTTSLFIITLLLIVSCDSTETNDGTISLSFSSGSSIQKIVSDTFTLDSVKILLRDVKMKQKSVDDTLNIRVGYFVVYLNLEGMTTDFAVGDVPPGTYDRVRFRVHKLEGSEIPTDPEFKEGSDSSLRYSVIVKGNVNSTPFIYKSRKSAHQDLKLDTPVDVGENEIANLTITVDPYSWFYNGGTLLDPTNPANENIIDNRIKDSFNKCFRDNNYDALED